MQKSVITLLLLTSPMWATLDGYSLYKQKCSMCHNEMTSVDEVNKNIATMKAPPIMEVSSHLKKMISVNNDDEDVKRELVLTFMRDYIINPSIDKSLCRLGALDRFDVMPSQKGNLTDEELHVVTEWVYDHFEGKTFKH